MATLLDETAVSAALSELSDWHGDKTAITREVDLPDGEVDGFRSGLETIAREMNHDPELGGSGGHLTITMSTHSAGGVTELDVEYARRVDALLSS
jgi:4a-hydroxytetrahydrobiopterin dehydratase